MCKDICTAGALQFATDTEGFWYPLVNKALCTKCGACVKTCPSLQPAQNVNHAPGVYAAFAKSNTLRLASTSGGVYGVLAGHIIEQGGSFAACVYGSTPKTCHHVLANTGAVLRRAIGSKYFQSDTEGIYKKVNEALLGGKPVLFCGAPCQNAALQAYLGKPYNNLYCVDYVCRGHNSPLAFAQYLTELEHAYGAKAVRVQFKNKLKGWRSLAVYVHFANGKTYLKDRYEDLWVRGYIGANLYMRPCCHRCIYKNLPRVADLSLADFWGVRGYSSKEMYKGISAILVNSEKGARLLRAASPKLVLEKRALEEFLPGNPGLLRAALPGAGRHNFFAYLGTMPFSKAAQKSMRETPWQKIWRLARKMRTVLRGSLNGYR